MKRQLFLIPLLHIENAQACMGVPMPRPEITALHYSIIICSALFVFIITFAISRWLAKKYSPSHRSPTLLWQILLLISGIILFYCGVTSSPFQCGWYYHPIEDSIMAGTLYAGIAVSTISISWLITSSTAVLFKTKTK